MELFATATMVSGAKPWFVSLFQDLRGLWKELRNPSQPIAITATPVEVPGLWSKRRTVVPHTLSVMAHAAIAVLGLVAWTAASKPFPKMPPSGFIDVSLYAPSRLVLPPSKDPGGGGGGRRQPTPPSLGKLPRAAGVQLTPPDPEPPKNLQPELIAEPTVIALQLPPPRLNLLNIGDPDGIVGPPSSGPGTGNGIGDGDGNGIGPSRGPGVGPGDPNGTGRPGSPRSSGGDLVRPVLVSQILPEYSEDARRARLQGRVILDTIVLEDGSVKVVRVIQGVGFGLDEQAIAAVLQWRFRPGRVNGRPAPMAMNVEVNFNLR